MPTKKDQLQFCPAQEAVVELLKACSDPQVWVKVEEVLKCIGACPAVAVLDDADQAGEPDPRFLFAVNPEQ